MAKARPQKSKPKPRSLKQREGPASNRRHSKALRAEEQARRTRRRAKPTRGMSAAAQKHPPAQAPQELPFRARLQEENIFSEAAAPSTLPLVAICGRPNVGKSTLFNRLTGSRRSIVGDEPGITRDRIYGEVEWEGRRARIVDTGGIVPDDDARIPSEIFRQARVALEDAAAIVLVVDGRSELASPDMELARLLLRTGKPVFLAVNKVDSAQQESLLHAFHSLGVREMFAVSAEHGNGIAELLDVVFAALPSEKEAAKSSQANPDVPVPVEIEEHAERGPAVTRVHGAYQQQETRVAIIGRPNVGKSTLLNALTGTARAIVSPIAGTTRDAVDEVVLRDGRQYRFVDTAGIRRKGKTTQMAEKLSVVMARKHLEASDCAVLVIDATEGVTALDATIGGYAHASGRSVVIAVNKWDLVGPARTDGKPPADLAAYEHRLRRALKFLDYAPVVFLSAQDATGHARHISRLFKDIALVAAERRKRVSTGQMNRFLTRVDFQRAPVPMARRMRIFYMTQAAVAPPTFVLFTDRDVKLHFAFERFLENQLRRAFGFVGAPIWFKVRARNKKEPA